MNERILELFKPIRKSKHTSNLMSNPPQVRYSYTIDEEDIEKFAKLIVAECMRMCEVTEMSFVTHGCDVEASGAITVKQFIAEHFGVD